MPTTVDPLNAVWAPRAISLLRAVTALLFLSHGLQKLAGFPVAPPFGLPHPFTLLWFAGVIELVGGGLLLVGLFSRPIAFLLSGEMAVAYWMEHAPHSAFPLINHGEDAILFCFIFLTLVATGPGPWALDALFRRRGTPYAT